MVESVNDWVGLGVYNPSAEDGGHFLLLRMDEKIIKALVLLRDQARELYDSRSSFSELGISATDVTAVYETDHADLEAFVVPFSEWKLIGKEACELMRNEGATVVLRFSTDHMPYVKLSSYAGIDYLDLRAGCDCGYDDIEIHVCAKSYSKEEYTDVMLMSGARVNALTSSSVVTGAHGSMFNEDAITASDTTEPTAPVPNEDGEIRCRLCGTLFDPDDYDLADSTACEDCHTSCDYCDDYFPTDQVNDEGYCTSCARQFIACAHCGDMAHEDDMEDGLCDYCSTRVSRCEGCDEFCETEDLVEGYCDGCCDVCSRCGEPMAPAGGEEMCASCRHEVEQPVRAVAKKKKKRRKKARR